MKTLTHELKQGWASQAIQTRYYGPTNYKPARIKAQAARGFIWISYDHAGTDYERHCIAAEALKQKFAKEDATGGRYSTLENQNPWRLPTVAGVLPDGSYAHCYMHSAQGGDK